MGSVVSEYLNFSGDYFYYVIVQIFYVFLAKTKLKRYFSVLGNRIDNNWLINDSLIIIIIHSSISMISTTFASYLTIAIITVLGSCNELMLRRFARPARAVDVRLIKAGLGFAAIGDFWLITRWILASAIVIMIETLAGTLLTMGQVPVFYIIVAGGAALTLLVLGAGGRHSLSSKERNADHELRDFISDGMLVSFGRSIIEARLRRQILSSVKPTAEASASARLDKTSSAQMGTLPGHEAPDIIVLVLESFFDIERSPLFDRRSLLPTLRRLTDDRRPWEVVPPVIGGKTANTEFEVLTGIPLAAVPSADVPFRDLSLDKDEALPRLFKQMGYGTTAMHPGARPFWNRHVAYPALGFDHYLALEDFHDARRLGPYVETDEVVARIEQVLHAAEGPQFVYALSILGHGPYDTDVEPRFPVELPDGLSEEVRRYCHLLTHADAALARLAAFVKGCSRPTVALVIGDHAPGFIGAVGLKELGFDCRQDRPEGDSEPSAWSVPLVQISNMPLPEPEYVRLPAYLLGGYLFSQLGLTGINRAGLLAERLKGCRQIDPYSVEALAPLASVHSYLQHMSGMFERQILTQELWLAFDKVTVLPDQSRIAQLIDDFAAHIATFGEDAFTLYRKGILECLSGRFLDSERTLDHAIKIGGLDQFWSRYWRGRAYMGRKAYYHARTDFEECARFLEMSIVELAAAEDSRLATTINLQMQVEAYLAAIQVEMAKLYQAVARKATETQNLKLYEFAVSKIEPVLPGPAAFIRGLYHMHNKKWKEAHAFLTVALDHNDQDFWSYIQRANCSLKLGRVQDAVGDLEAAERISPETKIVRDIRSTIKNIA